LPWIRRAGTASRTRVRLLVVVVQGEGFLPARTEQRGPAAVDHRGCRQEVRTRPREAAGGRLNADTDLSRRSAAGGRRERRPAPSGFAIHAGEARIRYTHGERNIAPRRRARGVEGHSSRDSRMGLTGRSGVSLDAQQEPSRPTIMRASTVYGGPFAGKIVDFRSTRSRPDRSASPRTS